MSDDITWVGMDAHKQSINVAMKLPGCAELVEWTVANEAGALKRLAKKLQREAPPGTLHRLCGSGERVHVFTQARCTGIRREAASSRASRLAGDEGSFREDRANGCGTRGGAETSGRRRSVSGARGS